jgi:hypothetical protein
LIASNSSRGVDHDLGTGQHLVPLATLHHRIESDHRTSFGDVEALSLGQVGRHDVDQCESSR